MVLYFHLFKTFPQFVRIHTVKGFSVVKWSRCFLWNSLAFSMIQWMVAICSLVPLPCLKLAWTFGISRFTYCWSLFWRILTITLLAYGVNTIVLQFEHSLALPFFGVGMKTDLFQSYGPCWVFQICWHIECSTFTASAFRIWKNSAGIPSCPLALSWCFLRPTWLHILECLAPGEWSHHHGYLGHEDLLCIVFLCILATFSWYLLVLLGPYHFCPLLCPSSHEMFPWHL